MKKSPSQIRKLEKIEATYFEEYRNKYRSGCKGDVFWNARFDWMVAHSRLQRAEGFLIEFAPDIRKMLAS